MSKVILPSIAPEQRGWNRLASEIVNRLLNRVTKVESQAVTKGDVTTYTAPTISNPPTDVEVQEMADRLAEIAAKFQA